MKRISVIFLVFIAPIILLDTSKTHAEDTSFCANDYGNQVNAVVQLDGEHTQIYARAGRVEDAKKAKLYYQQFATEGLGLCKIISDFTLSQDVWQVAGSLPSSVTGPVSIYMSIDSEATTQAGASSPAIILTKKDTPCALQTNCIVDYKGLKLELSPKKLSLGSDTIRVGALTSPENDAIKNVIYSVDGKQVYVKKTIEPFNERYVSGGEHTVERTAILKSGQSLSDKKAIKKGTYGDPSYWFTSLFTRYLKVILFISIILSAWIIGALWLRIARYFYKRHMWKLTHIAEIPDPNMPVEVAVPLKYEGSTMEVFKEHKKLFVIPFVSLLVVLFIVTFVLSIFTVDGISMDPTLKDKSKHLLFIGPAQLGNVIGNGYVPKRGSIVVVLKDENNLFAGAVQEKDYVVKRVVGLPEERIVVKDGIIKVFNKEHSDGFVPDDVYKWAKDITGSEYIKLDVTLKQNELFVIGDNRDNSIDSRFYGPIQASQVVGKVL